MRSARPRRRSVDRRRIRLVLPERPVGCRLAAAIGQYDREVRYDERADCRDRGEPAEVVDEHQDRRNEADGPDAHHDQIPALTVTDVLRQAGARLGDEVGFRMPPTGLHYSTLCRSLAARHLGHYRVSSRRMGAFGRRADAARADVMARVTPEARLPGNAAELS